MVRENGMRSTNRGQGQGQGHDIARVRQDIVKVERIADRVSSTTHLYPNTISLASRLSLSFHLSDNNNTT